MIKNLIFDFGGVIATTTIEGAIRRYREIGLADAENYLDPYTQKGSLGDLEVGKITDEQYLSDLSDLIGRPVSWKECQYALLGFLPDVPQKNLLALRKLRTLGYHIILLSNTNPFIMGWAMSDAFDGNGHSLADYVDAAYLSYECKMMKPDLRLFRMILEKENINAEDTLFVDDGQKNVDAAASLGFDTLCPEKNRDWTKEIFERLNVKERI